MTASARPSKISAARVDDLAARVTARLAGTLSTAPPPEAAEPQILTNPYAHAAAVLAWFDPARLRPLGGALSYEQDSTEVDAMLAASVRVTDAQGVRRWALRPDHRVAVLRTLRGQGLLDAALAANARPAADPIQQALDRGLRGEPAPLDDQSLPQLKATREAAAWLQAAGFGVSPSPIEIASRIEWRTLLQPFEHIAGKHFRGRQEELRRLREFVGILPPGSFLEAATSVAQRAVRNVAEVLFRRSPSFALVISGPGGVGKSALVARFILDHAQAHEADRFPFAYLDFDRPDISLEEPLTLLAEATRQLGIEYPEVRENCERLRATWLEQITEETSRSGTDRPTTIARVRAAAIRDTASGLGRLAGGKRPIVMVLDTFEEALYGGEAAVEEIWGFLDELRTALPPLRIVIAGRSEVDRAGVVPLMLSGFDEPSAVAYLQARGIKNAEMARRIFHRFGGSPLTLKLAADLSMRPDEMDDVFDVATRDVFYRKLSDENIQRQLYRRVLKHIHNPAIAKLAHPGLVLRRVTPELIQDVLSAPCGVPVATLDDARSLFEELKREISLVQADPDGALRHRQDLRLLMLGPLQADEPERSRRIHEAAVRFYTNKDSDSERAEELYHRLWLDQPPEEIDQRWRRGVRRYLLSAVPEFDPVRQAFLAARLNVSVTAEVRKTARLEDWERIAARGAAARLDDDDPDGALKLVTERRVRTNASPVVAVEALILLRLGRIGDALHALDDGFERATRAGERKAAAALALGYGDAVIRFEQTPSAALAAMRLKEAEAGRLGMPERILSMAQRAFLGELDAEAAALAPSDSELLDLIERATIQTLKRAREPALWAGAAPGADAAARVKRVVRAIGVPRTTDAAMRAFALALTSFDVAHSSAIGSEPGVLARRLGIPSRNTLTESWSAFVVDAPPAALNKAVEAVLDLEGQTDRAPLIAAMQDLMTAALGLKRGKALEGQSAPTTKRGKAAPRPPVSGTEELIEAIVADFTIDDLRASLRHRLHRSLDAYAAQGTPAEVVARLTEIAANEGWLLQLVAALLDARPDNHHFARVASHLGVSTLTGDSDVERALEQVMTSPGLLVDPRVWWARLGQIERSVCRVSVADFRHGSGFLVGPDLVLTAAVVVEDLINGKQPINSLIVTFDRRADARGNPLSQGVSFMADKSWLLATGRDRGVPYALLRIEGQPGAQPVGGTMTEGAAVLRRWLELPSTFPELSPGDPLAIAHYPEAGHLQLAFGAVAGLKPLRYAAATRPGSAGAPCFDARSLDPVAIHLGRDDKQGRAGFAVELGAVVHDLEASNLGSMLFARFA